MKKYQIIYADPPWSYNVASSKGTSRGVAERYYPVMKPKDIEALRVGDLADDAVLFMWATYPNLETALNVIKAWGFKFKTVAFTWVKVYPKSRGLVMGCGFWTRANAEIVLLATKGKNYPRRINAGVQQVLIEPRREHSRKPDKIKNRIIDLMGGGLKRIELFARQKTEGWDVWGNEVESDIELAVKP